MARPAAAGAGPSVNIPRSPVAPGIQAESRVTISYNNNVGTGTYSQNDKLNVDGKILGRTNARGLALSVLLN